MTAIGKCGSTKLDEFTCHLWHPYQHEFMTDETVKKLREVLLSEKDREV